MKSILIGSVGSSKVALEEIIKNEFPVSMVFSLDERYAENVSGYYPLHELAEENNIPYRKFRRINDTEHINLIEDIEPDYIFVIGLSQLISRDIIRIARKGTVGFHPTPLPKYRGRAAIAWQVLLGVERSKSSLFFIDEGMDSGDIIAQEEYIIGDNDYAIDVLDKCREALRQLLRRALPQMKDGTITATTQNEAEATYLLKRTPEDGAINWNDPVEKIQRLIRAVSRPYPGAFSHYDGKHKVIIWRADYLENNKYIGIPGQIADKTKSHIDVVCVDGLLRVYEYEILDNVKIVVGHRLK